MRKLSFYEQISIVTPGSVFLFGIMFYIPELKDILAKEGFSIGGLGIFIIIAFATGHLLAALGNIIENIYWQFHGGTPSNWIAGINPRLLSVPQINKIEILIATRFEIKIPPISEFAIKDWSPIFRQIYSDVEANGKPKRANTFNGNYGLNRGLCAAAFALSIFIIIISYDQWTISLTLLIVGLIYLYRMHRFGVHYAKEIYNQFLLLPPKNN